MAAKNAENAKDMGLCPRPLKPLRPLRTLRLVSTCRPLFSCLLPLLLCAFSANAENAYTNHAGNVVSGVVVALDARTVTISNATETAKLPLSIFPESEQRRIAADAGQPRVPVAVKRAIAGAEKAMARSRKRAEKGLCTKEESEAFCAKSETALRSYLDKQVESGTITPAERKALRR